MLLLLKETVEYIISHLNILYRLFVFTCQYIQMLLREAEMMRLALPDLTPFFLGVSVQSCFFLSGQCFIYEITRETAV